MAAPPRFPGAVVGRPQRAEYDRQRRWLRSPSSPGSRRRCRSSPASCCRARRSSRAAMAEHLYAAIPELAAIEDDELRAELLASTEANIGQVLRLLAHGASTDDVVVPHEALEFLRGNVRRGIPLAGAAALLPARPRVAVGALVAGAAGARRGLRRARRRAGPELGVHVRLRRQGLRRPGRGVRERARAHDAQRRAAARGDGARDPRRRAGRRGGRLAAARLRAAAPPRRAAGRERGKRGPRARARGRRGRGRARRRASRSSCRRARRASTCGGARSTLRRRTRSSATSRRRACCVAFGRPGEGIAGFRSSHAEALQAARIGVAGPRRDGRR